MCHTSCGLHLQLQKEKHRPETKSQFDCFSVTMRLRTRDVCLHLILYRCFSWEIFSEFQKRPQGLKYDSHLHKFSRWSQHAIHIHCIPLYSYYITIIDRVVLYWFYFTGGIYLSVSPFHLRKTILISYTHRNAKVFTATRQNEEIAAEIFVQQNVHSTTYKITKT